MSTAHGNYDRTSGSSSFVRNWWQSRQLIMLLRGMPAVLMAVTCAATMSWTLHQASQHVPAYQRELAAAVNEQDDNRAEIALHTLLQMQPGDRTLLFNMAQIQFRRENYAHGFSLIQQLADAGDARASVWLSRLLLDQSASISSAQRVIELLQRIVAGEKNHAEAHALLGDAYLQMNQSDLAAPHIEAAARLDPVHWLKFAQLLGKRGNSEAAREKAALASAELKTLVAAEPSNVVRRIQWAEALRLQGELQHSVEAVHQGLSLTPHNRDLRAELCRILADQAEAERAGGIVNVRRYSRLLQQALKHAPTNRDVLEKLAAVPVHEHQVDRQLLEKIDAAMRNTPSSGNEGDVATQRALQAWVRFQINRHDESVFPLLHAAAEHRPELALRIAEFHRALGNSKKADLAAKRYLGRLQQIETPNVSEQLQLAATLVFLNQWEAALDALSTAADSTSSPDHEQQPEAVQNARVRYTLRYFQHLDDAGDRPERKLSLATELLSVPTARRLAIAGLGRLSQFETRVGRAATGTLNRLLADGKDVQQIHTQFGTNALINHEHTRAVRHLEQALNYAPDDPLICNNLAWALGHSGNQQDHERALMLTSRALTRLPNNPNILVTRGFVLLQMERDDEALHDLESALPHLNDTQTAHELLANVYARLGNPEIARQHQQHAQNETQSGNVQSPGSRHPNGS